MNRSFSHFTLLSAAAILLTLWFTPCAWSADEHHHDWAKSKAPSSDQSFWPSSRDLWRVLLLRDYNTRLVVLSTASLGLSAGLVGSFLLLRKRSLMGDALSHATLPGIAAAFLMATALGGAGKSLPVLLAGAALFGLLGVGSVMFITAQTRLKPDAAMGVVLGVFFGVGVALLTVIQQLPVSDAAGLKYYIYGRTATMIWSDLMLIVSVSAIVMAISAVLFKEFAVLCFDEGYAGAQGWPVRRLDALMLALVTAVTVIGLQAVGLILVIALLIIPPAAARFWTYDLKKLAVLAALIGAVSGWVGSSISALAPQLPAGAVIVLVASAVFVISLLIGAHRGVLLRAVGHARLIRTVNRQHLLRAFYELTEPPPPEVKPPVAMTSPDSDQRDRPIRFEQLWVKRSWSARRLRRLLGAARRDDLIRQTADQQFALTSTGLCEAARVARNHRLWEIYLVTHADVAPSHVDRDADMIEHVLGADLVAKLEALLADQAGRAEVPTSLHDLTAD